MRIIKKILIQLVIIFSFIFFSECFSLFATIAGFNELYGFLFYAANWPSILLKIYPLIVDDFGNVVFDAGDAIFNPVVILINSVPWIIIGYFILFIVLRRKRRKTQTSSD
jgi:hypothetical protein